MPVDEKFFTDLADEIAKAQHGDELKAIVTCLHEQALFNKNLAYHVELIAGHLGALTEKLVGLQDEVRAAVCGQPSSDPEEPKEDNKRRH